MDRYAAFRARRDESPSVRLPMDLEYGLESFEILPCCTSPHVGWTRILPCRVGNLRFFKQDSQQRHTIPHRRDARRLNTALRQQTLVVSNGQAGRN